MAKKDKIDPSMGIQYCGEVKKVAVGELLEEGSTWYSYDEVKIFKVGVKTKLSTNYKVLILLKEKKGLTKKGLSLSLGMSRPTLDSRIRLKNKWKTLEQEFINTLFEKWNKHKI